MAAIWKTAGAALRWIVTHPAVVVALVLAAYALHLRGEVRDLGHDLAESRLATAGAEIQRDAARRDVLIEQGNAAAARAANISLAGSVRHLRARMAENLEIAADARRRAASAAEALRIATDTLRHLARLTDGNDPYATDPACRAMRDLPVCGAVADRLRESARIHDPAAAAHRRRD